MTDTQAEAYEQLTDWNVQLVEGGRWYTVALSCTEVAATFNSGLLDSKPVAAIRSTYISDSDHPEIGGVWLVYDFIMAKQGIPAWRLSHVPA